MRRRALLATVGGAIPVSIAGCLGDDDENGEQQADDGADDDDEDADENGDEPEAETDDDEDDGDDQESEEEDEPEEEEEEPAELDIDEEISVTADSLDPSLTIVERGAVVGWTTGEGTHPISFYHQDNGTQTRVPVETEPVDDVVTEEEPLTVELTQEGVYDYYHSDSEEDGVVGSIVVGAVSDVTQPGLSIPTADIPDAARAELQSLNEAAATELDIELEEPPQSEGDVELTAGRFEPSMLRIDSGGTISWSATDDEYEVAFYHEDIPVVIESEDQGNGGEDEDTNDETETEPRQHRVPDGVEPFQSTLSAGEQASFEFETDGIYDYYCQETESEGMVGTLIVGQISNQEQPGLHPPDETIPEAASEELNTLNQRTQVRLTVDEVNAVITELNHQEEQSISVLNSYIEGDDTVSYIAPVEAETAEEAGEEADRVRTVRDDTHDRILHVVPQEANRQLPIPPIFSADDIETPDDAREEADRLEDEEASEVYGEAPERLREAADFTDALDQQLTELAAELDSVAE